MKLKNTALVYNVTVNGRSNCDWGTEIGQSKKHTFTTEGFPDIVNAMVYYKIDDIENIKVILGKGNRTPKKFSEYEGTQLVLASCFDKIYLNNAYLEGQKLLMYILKDISELNSNGEPNVHFNRCTLKFSNSLLYNEEPVNQKCIDAITNAFGLSANGSWAILEMVICNEDELHLFGFPIDNVHVDYASKEERNSDFEKRMNEYAKAKRREAFKNYLFAPNTFKTEGAAKNYWKHIDELFYKERLSFVWDKLSELLGFESDDLFEIDNPEGATKLYDMVQPLQENKDYGNQLASAILKKYIDFLKDKSSKKTTSDKGTYIIPSDFPLQQIFYGAPGTGKSHETNRVTRVYRDTIRTTFHPDSDYSTFVGAYKPTTTEEKMYGLDSHGKTVPYEYAGKPLETTKIVYKFIPQAFIKAYVQAWKKMAQMTVTAHATTSKGPIILEGPVGSNLSWKITEIKGQDIYLESCLKLVKEDFKTSAKDLWDKAWKSGEYTQDVFTTFQRYEQMVCNWIYQNLENNNFEEGWDKFIAELNNGTLELKVDPFSTRKCKTYCYHIDGDTIIINANLHTTQDAIGTCFEQEKDPTNFQQAVANKLKEYSKDIDEAWQKLEEELEHVDGSNTIKVESQFLVIEEINRGNCAQIFGDLFQLLDRTKNGFSEYPIEADEDISKYIKEELKELAFNQEIIDYINQQFVDGDMNPLTYDIDDNRVYALDAILNGKILVLPANLYIWATMNTSDQSLFPIDSAFKRRWDWEYVPIKYANDKWMIDIHGTKYSWVAFQREVNKRIYDINHSEDKMLGDFFVKADKNDVISHSVFLNKILFYLWNDVCKDGEGDIFKTSVNKAITFSDLYGPNGTENLIAMMEYLKVELEGSDEENESIVEDEATN